MYTNPFNQRTSAILSRLLRIPPGGLKGKIAPSAMPTLAVGAFFVSNYLQIMLLML